MLSSGPFASAAVPEDLDELHDQELKAIGRVTVRRNLERFHYALVGRQSFARLERNSGAKGLKFLSLQVCNRSENSLEVRNGVLNAFTLDSPV